MTRWMLVGFLFLLDSCGDDDPPEVCALPDDERVAYVRDTYGCSNDLYVFDCDGQEVAVFAPCTPTLSQGQ